MEAASETNAEDDTPKVAAEAVNKDNTMKKATTKERTDAESSPEKKVVLCLRLLL